LTWIGLVWLELTWFGFPLFYFVLLYFTLLCFVRPFLFLAWLTFSSELALLCSALIGFTFVSLVGLGIACLA
jgi:hypothetical protein